MARIKAGKKPTLIDLMAKNTDLTLETQINQPLIGDPTLASLGSEAPSLDEAITALLSMANCQARWNWNFWLVTSWRGGARGHVHATATFDDWRTVINDMAGGGFGS